MGIIQILANAARIIDFETVDCSLLTICPYGRNSGLWKKAARHVFKFVTNGSCSVKSLRKPAFSFRCLRVVSLIAFGCLVLSSHPTPVQAYDGQGWMNFGNSSPSTGWGQPFDRSFARQWENNPQRGFPTLSKQNIIPLKAAIKRYAAIVVRGGWKPVPKFKLRTGSNHIAVAYLRRRLEITGDLRQRSGYPKIFDSYVDKALKRFQERHGLTPTGVVDKRTLAALNVPASARLRQLRTNLVRLKTLAKAAASRYVLVNVPAAQVEAVENDQVVSRHSAVVGKLDRQTPVLRSKIFRIKFNPTWTVPPTVIEKDIIPKGLEMRRRGRSVLARYGIDAYRSYGGPKLDPNNIDWSSPAAKKYVYRQQPGKENPLGFVKLDFHNRHAVYLHDTPSKTIFGRNFRAASSGCVRVQNIQQLITWLMRDVSGWDRARIDQMKQTGETANIKLKTQVPIYLVYLTGWATIDGLVHFRRDLYRRDGVVLTASAY